MKRRQEILFILFFATCTKFYKPLKTPKQELENILNKYHKGKIIQLLIRGNITLSNDIYISGKFEIKMDSNNIDITFFSPFGTQKIERKKEDIRYFINLYFSPLYYLNKFRVEKAFETEKEKIFVFENKTKMFFSEKGTLKKIIQGKSIVIFEFKEKKINKIVLKEKDYKLVLKIEEINGKFKRK